MTLDSKKKIITAGIGENIGDFETLSKIVGSQVDIRTGEVQDIVTISNNSSPERGADNPGYSDENNTIRLSTGDWGQYQIQKLIPGSKILGKKGLWDVQKGDLKVEVKTVNLGNASMMKSVQLEKLNQIDGNVYYSFVFYKIKGGGKPSELSKDKIPVGDKMELYKIYIFPIEYVVFVNNVLPQINTIHTPFKKMHHSSVLELFKLAQSKGMRNMESEQIYAVGDIIDILKK